MKTTQKHLCTVKVRKVDTSCMKRIRAPKDFSPEPQVPNEIVLKSNVEEHTKDRMHQKEDWHPKTHGRMKTRVTDQNPYQEHQ